MLLDNQILRNYISTTRQDTPLFIIEKIKIIIPIQATFDKIIDNHNINTV